MNPNYEFPEELCSLERLQYIREAWEDEAVTLWRDVGRLLTAIKVRDEVIREFASACLGVREAGREGYVVRCSHNEIGLNPQTAFVIQQVLGDTIEPRLEGEVDV